MGQALTGGWNIAYRNALHYERRRGPYRELLEQSVRRCRDLVAGGTRYRLAAAQRLHPREIAPMEEAVKRLSPHRCLAWGAGEATLRLPGLLAPGAIWIGIEEDAISALRLRHAGLPAGAKAAMVPPDVDNPPERPEFASYTEYSHYVEFPEAFAPCDFIVIAGAARAACLRKAHDLLGEGGLVVALAHDSRAMREAVDIFPHWEYVSGPVPADRSLWLAAKGRRIRDTVDVELHRATWAAYGALRAGLWK